MRVTSQPLLRRAALCLFSSPLLLPALPSLQLPALAADPQPDPASGITTRSGLKFIDFRRGEGETPRFGQLIRFHYVAYALPEREGDSIKIFDNSYERKVPYFTKHGNGYTCQGLEEAIHSMRPGGRRRVILPPSLGFTADKGPLPPGPRQRDTLYGAINARQPVIYDLELLSAVDDLLDRGDYEDLDMIEANEFARDQQVARSSADAGDGPMGKGT